jgi:hypothetical protein
MNNHGFDTSVVVMIAICFSLDAIITLLGGSVVNEEISTHFGFIAYQLFFWVTNMFSGLMAQSMATAAVKRNGVIAVNMGMNWLLKATSGFFFAILQVGILYSAWLILKAVYMI